MERRRTLCAAFFVAGTFGSHGVDKGGGIKSAASVFIVTTEVPRQSFWAVP